MTGTTILLGLLLLVGGVGILCNWRSQAAFDRAVNEESRSLVLAGNINSATSAMMLGETRFILLTLQNDPDASEAAKQSVHASSSRAIEIAGNLGRSMTAPKDKQLLEQLTANISQWNGQFGEMEQALSGDNIPSAMAANDRMQPLYKSLCSLGQQIEREQSTALDNDKRTARLRAWTANIATAIALFVALAVGSVVIKEVRKTNSTLQELAADISTHGQNIGTAANEVSHASHELAQQASEQMSSLHETASSAKQVLSVVRQSSDSARTAVQLMADTETQVQEGDRIVGELSAQMKLIADTSRSISSIVNNVEEIAFQTKILSLNAAIEAAHAGSAGAGFSAVATEVKNLAERCTLAAQESRGLLDRSAHCTSQGVKGISSVQSAMKAITGQCANVRELVVRIDAGTREQTQQLARIDETITQLESATEAVASSAQESAAIAEEFNAQAGALKAVVERLSGFVDGKIDDADDTTQPRAQPGRCFTHSQLAGASVG